MNILLIIHKIVLIWVVMTEVQQIRERIIEAARERFEHYGYPKTTIAELASDCAMSPGNIYRFFKGKIDIAAEIARREALAAVDKVELVLECERRTARKRLEDIVFADLRHTYHLLKDKPRTMELAQTVMRERPHFQIESLRREHRVFQRILREGVTNGEFADINIPRATIALQAATLKYRYAPLFTDQTLEELERELASVMTLLMRGLINSKDVVQFEATVVPSTASDTPEMLAVAVE